MITASGVVYQSLIYSTHISLDLRSLGGAEAYIR